MKKITERTNEEKSTLGRMCRKNNIGKFLNSCFKETSLDDDDQETILRWACLSISNGNLIYLLEKIKWERMNR